MADTIDRDPGANTGPALRKKESIFRTYQVIWYILGVIQVLLGLRFLMRLLAANPANPFVSFIYTLSGIFVAPFQTIFPTPGGGGSVLEISTLFAMIIYWLLAVGLIKVMQLGKPVSREEVADRVDDPEVRL
jgi:uncharacterized protein YggT (Ycf19 family)